MSKLDFEKGVELQKDADRKAAIDERTSFWKKNIFNHRRNGESLLSGIRCYALFQGAMYLDKSGSLLYELIDYDLKLYKVKLNATEPENQSQKVSKYLQELFSQIRNSGFINGEMLEPITTESERKIAVDNCEKTMNKICADNNVDIQSDAEESSVLKLF